MRRISPKGSSYDGRGWMQIHMKREEPFLDAMMIS
jgi:hypothetical protein